MGSTYTWHKGARRVAPTWSISSDINQDELFSSWLIRNALLNGCDPLTLAWNLWPDWRPWTIDIDRFVALEKLSYLSQCSGISVKEIHATTLYNLAQRIAPTRKSRKTIWPWILAIGARNRKRKRYALQYCPICLQNDQAPYFRIQWRLAWHTVCHQHECLLWDKCPSCGSPIQPHTLTGKECSIAICSSCKFDLKNSPSQNASSHLISFQKKTDQAAISNKAIYNGIKLTAKEWFELAHFFSLLVRKICSATITPYQRLLEYAGLDYLKHILCPPRVRIELLPADDRVNLLLGTHHLTSRDFSSLQTILHDVEATRQCFCPKGTYLPPVLQEIYFTLPDNAYQMKHKSKRRQRKLSPTPRSVVEKKIQRLLKIMDFNLRE